MLEWLKVREKYLEEKIKKTRNFRKVGKTPINELDDRIFLFSPNEANVEFSKVLKKIGMYVKDERAKIATIRLHSFRKFFKTALLNAGVPSELTEALLGHKGGIEQVYTRFTKDQVRQWYKRAEPELTIFGSAEVEKFKEQLKKKEEELKKRELEIEERMKRFEEELRLKLQQESLVYKSTLEGLVKDKFELEARLKVLEKENARLRQKLEELEQTIITILSSKWDKIKIGGRTDKEIVKAVENSNPDFVID